MNLPVAHGEETKRVSFYMYKDNLVVAATNKTVMKITIAHID